MPRVTAVFSAIAAYPVSVTVASGITRMEAGTTGILEGKGALSGPKLAALSLGGIAITAGVAVITATNQAPETAALAATGRALTVGIPFAVGLYAWRRGLGKRFGPLLTLIAVLWSLTALAESGNDVLYSSGRVAGWVFEAALVYLMLSFPTGRLPTGIDRWLFGVAAGAVAVLFLPTALLVDAYPEPSPYGSCDTGCPSNAFLVLGSEPAFIDSVVRPLREVLSALLFGAVTFRLAQRITQATPPMRRSLAPVLAVAAVRTTAMAVAFPVRAVTSADSPILDAIFWIFAAALPLMAIAFLVGELHSRLFISAALRRLGSQIGATPSSGTLRAAVAETLGDPSLEVAYWAAEGGWVDASGSPVELPGRSSERCVTEVRHGRRRVAALIYDPALRGEADFVEAVGVYALVAFENQRLIARVEASTREVSESRSRIIASADRERRRIERDLHDGAQQQLVALRIHLQLMGETLASDPEGARERLHTLGDDVEHTLDSIRSLAHGVYPPLLEDLGLVEALRSAMRGVPIPASVSPDGSGRYAPAVESAVYFCCLEAVQNASKHAAGAHHIAISLTQGDRLRFEVRDDGGGFDIAASPPGAGLVNMRDRLAALGGDLTVTSTPGTGTTVAGSLPALVREPR